jgi:hypothetical protein
MGTLFFFPLKGVDRRENWVGNGTFNAEGTLQHILLSPESTSSFAKINKIPHSKKFQLVAEVKKRGGVGMELKDPRLFPGWSSLVGRGGRGRGSCRTSCWCLATLRFYQLS